MRLATYVHQGRTQFGRVSADGMRVAPLPVPDPMQGMLYWVQSSSPGAGLAAIRRG